MSTTGGRQEGAAQPQSAPGPRPPEPGRWGPVSAPPAPGAAGGPLAGAAAGPALGGAYGERSSPDDAGAWALPPMRLLLLRALDPRLTGRLRAERDTYRILAARLRRGSSIVVLGTWPQQQAAVSALLAVAIAQFQGRGVLAVDASADNGLRQRLADRPGGSTEALLAGLAIRGPDAGQPPVVPARQWLRQRLDLADGVQLLAGDPARAEPRLRGAEYDAVVGLLSRYVTLFVTHAPPPEGERIVEAAVRRADRVVVVAPDTEVGHAGVREWLPWLAWAGHRPEDGDLVAALLPAETDADGSAPGAAGDRGTPDAVAARRGVGAVATRRGVGTVAGLRAVRLPADPALLGAGRLRWHELGPQTRGAALTLAAVTLRGLELVRSTPRR